MIEDYSVRSEVVLEVAQSFHVGKLHLVHKIVESCQWVHQLWSQAALLDLQKFLKHESIDELFVSFFVLEDFNQCRLRVAWEDHIGNLLADGASELISGECQPLFGVVIQGVLLLGDMLAQTTLMCIMLAMRENSSSPCESIKAPSQSRVIIKPDFVQQFQFCNFSLSAWLTEALARFHNASFRFFPVWIHRLCLVGQRLSLAADSLPHRVVENL